MNSIYENDDIVNCPTIYAPGSFGYFATTIESSNDMHNVYWDKCREQFAKKFTEDLKGFFYSTYDKYADAVPNFIRQTENFLNLSDYTKFYRSSRENVIYMVVAPFWKNCYMKRSLFTLICRLGLCYDGNWEDTLLGVRNRTHNQEIDANYDMARKTNKAIIRFFLGFTKYVGCLDHLQKEYFPEKHGWVTEFANKSNDYIKQLLVLEDCAKCILSNNYIFGKELLLK